MVSPFTRQTTRRQYQKLIRLLPDLNALGRVDKRAVLLHIVVVGLRQVATTILANYATNRVAFLNDMRCLLAGVRFGNRLPYRPHCHDSQHCHCYCYCLVLHCSHWFLPSSSKVGNTETQVKHLRALFHKGLRYLPERYAPTPIVTAIASDIMSAMRIFTY